MASRKLLGGKKNSESEAKTARIVIAQHVRFLGIVGDVAANLAASLTSKPQWE